MLQFWRSWRFKRVFALKISSPMPISNWSYHHWAHRIFWKVNDSQAHSFYCDAKGAAPSVTALESKVVWLNWTISKHHLGRWYHWEPLGRSPASHSSGLWDTPSLWMFNTTKPLPYSGRENSANPLGIWDFEDVSHHRELRHASLKGRWCLLQSTLGLQDYTLPDCPGEVPTYLPHPEIPESWSDESKLCD